MKHRTIVAIALTIAIGVLAVVPAKAYELDKKWLVELQLGMWSATDGSEVSVSPGNVVSSYDGSGIMGGVGFGRWLQENVALVLSARGLGVEGETAVNFTGVTSRTASVTFLGLGARYYPLRSSLESKMRPYLSISAGPVIGYEAKHESGITVINEETTATAMGGHVGVGGTFLLSRVVYLGAELGACLMSDFGEQINGRINYSTGEFAIVFGLRF